MEKRVLLSFTSVVCSSTNFGNMSGKYFFEQSTFSCGFAICQHCEIFRFDVLFAFLTLSLCVEGCFFAIQNPQTSFCQLNYCLHIVIVSSTIAFCFMWTYRKSANFFIVIFTSGQTLQAPSFLLFYDYWKLFSAVSWQFARF